MKGIEHHIPERLLIAYAAGTLPKGFSLVVAAHVSMCDTCRAALEAHYAMGGALLEKEGKAAVSDEIKTDLMARLDEPAPEEPVFGRDGPYPGPVMAAMKGRAPRWRSLGAGVKQSILSADETGSVRLLSIPAGQAVPDHGHSGLELTMVLQGAFADETGTFGVGDVEVADEELEHTPTAAPGDTCICLAATDAPLRFSGFLPRVLQPFFGI
ncbi:ChrR family anti-sigma-E factor [Psychromarinibacter sp. C21-152]|uniref:ChrR family anti-sigma-E factor n=1 Tax=Psychromarinibacter sediminicola TaxID=3033385 RepID=A0AAE3TA11_9RHOB|nr:ChrR family anti-sigma-E factor [Psychromarinibacter sediminicola]MDF0601120.1 ChrR family anti-sigma-E factor [Psychromarinibacter sediminicola]